MQGPSPKSNLKSHKLISSKYKNATMAKSSTITQSSKSTNYSNNNNTKGSFIKNSIINSTSLFKPEQHNQIKTSNLLRNKKLKDKKQIIKKNLTINHTNTNNISNSSNNNNKDDKEKKDRAAPIKIKNFHSAVNSGGLNNIRIPNKNNNLIKKKQMLKEKEIKNKTNKTSNTLINNISNNKISYPKIPLNTNPSRKNQLNKIKSFNNKNENNTKKPLIITTTNSIEKITLKHKKMKLNDMVIKNNKNINLKNSSLNEESQKKESSKGNHSNRNSKKNSIIMNKKRNKKINNHRNNINRINNDENNQIEYGKIFGLLNNEIKEITDLFKRTQSVDQQKNKDKEMNINENLPIYTEGNNYDSNIIDSDLFERECDNEEDKLIDVSQLENEEVNYSDNKNKTQSILFSSYNSELYKNLINTNQNNNEGDEIIDNDYTNLSATSLHNNMIQIARNNINYQEKNNLNKNSNDKSIINDKTECQFIDIDFNKAFVGVEVKNIISRNEDSNFSGNILDGIDSEKTDTLIDENNINSNASKNLPIQEIMQKIRGD
jgi:hypothetical protein